MLHLLFACTVWGHNLGVRMALHIADGSTTSRMEATFRVMLRWAIVAPQHMRDSKLYLLALQIPLHGHIMKKTVRYFGTLEWDKLVFSAVQWLASVVEGRELQELQQQLHWPRWAAGFVSSTVAELEGTGSYHSTTHAARSHRM